MAALEHQMDFNRFILRLRLHKLDDCPAEATMMLHELVPDSKVHSGYLLINDKDCCWHVWLETPEGTIMDIGWEMAILKDSAFKYCKIERLETKPENIEVHEDQELIKRFESHVGDFWKTAPKKFKEFRTKFKKSLNK